MSRALTPALEMRAKTTIRRLRELPVLGEVLVQPGDSVESSSKVARADLPGELHILRVPEAMGIQVFEVMDGLQVNVGDAVEVGQVLCEHTGLFGLFRSRFQSPVAGVVELITERTGHVAVREAPVPIEIDAYISGRVAEVTPEKSVLLETEGTFIQGIFGIGGERYGQLRKIAAADELLTLEHIPADCRTAILFGGLRPTIEVLQTIAERGGVGLITGSLDDALIKEYLGYDLGIALTGDEDVPLTLIMTEGFGTLAISRRCYSLLEQCDGMHGSISGATQVRAGAVRPEIIVPNTNFESSSVDRSASLEVGATVRIIRVPYFGKRATVTALPAAAQKIETGALARVLVATLEDGTEIQVPRANVELV